MKISDFYKDEYSGYASYDAYRSIAHVVDGLKPTARKVLFTIIEKNIKDSQKVSNFASKVSEFSQYLHGPSSMESVIVGMAKDYCGSNNLNLLEPEGTFGNRLIQDAAAARYIFTKKSKNFDKVFHKDDFNLVENQEFEGDKIEPKFYVPILPMLLVNGSAGIGTGFSQNILPRNPEKIQAVIEELLNKNKTSVKAIPPYFKDFTGKINLINEEKRTWEILGKVKIDGVATITIIELPVGYDLKGYQKVLDTLEDKGIIVSYKDYSEDGKFKFEVKVKKGFIVKNKPRKILEKLKLIKQITENFTVIDEENKIQEFSNEIEILEYFFMIRTEYYEKRKSHLINSLKINLETLYNKFKFIKAILDGHLKINNVPKKEIEKNLIKMKIEQKSNSFDYLLNLPLHSLTKETVNKLEKEIKKKISEVKKITKKSIKSFYLEDLKCQNK